MNATLTRNETFFRFPLPPPSRPASNSAMEELMQERTVTICELALLAGTRIAFGVGLGLLLAERLGRDTRRGAGCALLAVGAITTIPLVMGVLTRHSASGAPESA